MHQAASLMRAAAEGTLPPPLPLRSPVATSSPGGEQSKVKPPAWPTHLLTCLLSLISLWLCPVPCKGGAQGEAAGGRCTAGQGRQQSGRCVPPLPSSPSRVALQAQLLKLAASSVTVKVKSLEQLPAIMIGICQGAWAHLPCCLPSPLLRCPVQLAQPARTGERVGKRGGGGGERLCSTAFPGFLQQPAPPVWAWEMVKAKHWPGGRTTRRERKGGKKWEKDSAWDKAEGEGRQKGNSQVHGLCAPGEGGCPCH